jgi:hypothetical protein
MAPLDAWASHIHGSKPNLENSLRLIHSKHQKDVPWKISRYYDLPLGFLGASKRFYKRLCWSDGWLVGRSVGRWSDGWLVERLVGRTVGWFPYCFAPGELEQRWSSALVSLRVIIRTFLLIIRERYSTSETRRGISFYYNVSRFYGILWFDISSDHISIHVQEINFFFSR